MIAEDEFAGVRLRSKKTDEFSGVRLKSQDSINYQRHTWGNRAASLGKSVAAGVGGSLPDAASLVYNLPAMGANYLAKKGLPLGKAQEYKGENPDAEQLPLIPSATQAINEGIDNLTDGYTETPKDQQWLNQGVEFASGMLGGGAAAKGLQAVGKTGASKVANVAGSTNPWHIGGAGVAGGVMSKSQNRGDSTLETMGKATAAQMAFNAIPSILTKGGFALTGLNKSNLNLDAAKAGKDLDMNLPKAVVTDNGLTGLADQFLSKMPVSGNIMKSRYAKIGEKVLKELDNAYDSVISSEKLVGIETEIKKMYDASKTALPKEAQTIPTNTVNAIQNIRDDIKAFAYSDDYQKIISHIDKIEKNIAPHNIKNIPTEVKMLVNQKENTGNLIYGGLKTSKGKYYAQQLDQALKSDLATYGKSNPEWYKYFSGADALYSKKETRKSLENLLAGKAESANHGGLTYGSLSTVLNTADSKEQLKELLKSKPEIFERLEKLGTVAQAMAHKNHTIPNPSGTAVTQTAINVLGGLTGVSTVKYGLVDPTTAVSSVIGAAGVAHLLTDKKTLDLAIKLAEKPTEKAAVAFNIRMKQLTGYTPVTLAREVAKREEEEQDKQGTSMRKKFNDHIEKNKKRPKGQALIKGLSNPTVQKGAEIWSSNPWKN